MPRLLAAAALAASLAAAAGQASAGSMMSDPDTPLPSEWENPDMFRAVPLKPGQEAGQPPDGITEEEDLARIKAWLENVKTLKAPFMQIAPNQNVSQGTFYLQRPGRLRFEYQPPSEMLIVSNGGTVTMVDYNLRQVTRWPLSDTPLKPLTQAEVAFGKDVEVVKMDRSAHRIAATIVDPDDPEQGTITLSFQREPLSLIGWTVTDASRQDTVLVLGKPVINTELDNDLWDFDDPRPPSRVRSHGPSR
jgi:outer membrane lipoprotein-sorting protein